MTALLAAAHAANDAFTSTLPALLPTLGQRFAMSGAELAMLVAIFSLSTSLPQPLLGGIADRMGGRVVGALGLALTATLVSLLGRTTSQAGLVTLLLIGGLGSAAVHPAGVGLARHVGGRQPGTVLAIFAAGGMLGSALGPVGALAIAARFGVDAVAWTMVPGLALAALVYRYAPRSAHQPARRAPRGHLKRVLAQGPVPVLVVASTLATTAYLTFMNAVPLWLVDVRGLDAQSGIIGLTLAVFSASAAAGGLLAGVVARQVGRARTVAGSLVLALPPLLGVLAVGPESLLYLALVGAAGALLFMHTPLLVLTAQELSPGAESAASGMMMGVTSAAGGVIYAVINQAQTAIGVTATIALSLTAVLPAAGVAWQVMRTLPSSPEGAYSPSMPLLVCLCTRCLEAPVCLCSVIDGGGVDRRSAIAMRERAAGLRVCGVQLVTGAVPATD